MANSLAYHSFGRHTGETLGHLVPQSLQVFNCLYDISQAVVISSPSPTARIPYRHTGSDVDFGIREGEIVFAIRGTLGSGQLSVRSCLNNISVNSATEEDALLKLEDHIVHLGVSISTCNVNSLNIKCTPSPAVTASGLMTMLNSCSHTTMPGDILIMCMPDVNRNSQCPTDGSSSMTALRRIIEPVPLRVLLDPFLKNTGGNAATRKLFPNKRLLMLGDNNRHFRNLLIEVNVWSAVVNRQVVNAAGFNVGTDNEKADRFFDFDNPDQRDIDYPNNVMEEVRDTVTTRVDRLLICMMSRDKTKSSKALERIVKALVPVSMLVHQMCTAKMCGRVIRGGLPGRNHDVSISFGVNGATERVLGGL